MAGTESTTRPHLQADGAELLLLFSNSVIISRCYFLLSKIPAALQSFKAREAINAYLHTKESPTLGYSTPGICARLKAGNSAALNCCRQTHKAHKTAHSNVCSRNKDSKGPGTSLTFTWP